MKNNKMLYQEPEMLVISFSKGNVCTEFIHGSTGNDSNISSSDYDELFKNF